MSQDEKEKITKVYQKLERLLKKHLPAKREGSLHGHVHLTLMQSRMAFEASWDEHEDAHLENSELGRLT